SKLISSLNIAESISIMKNGKEAIAFLRKLDDEGLPCPELILFDINMPIMDGYEFFAQFKKIPYKVEPTVKLVVLSTSSLFKDIDRFKSLGIDDYITKPLSKDKLKPVLEK